MGARRLRRWLLYPLLGLKDIVARHNAVQELVENFSLRQELKTGLEKVQDLERLAGRVVSGSALPKDLIAIKDTLSAVNEIRRQLEGFCAELLTWLHETRELLRQNLDLIDDDFRRSAAANLPFFSILKWKDSVYETLLEMHRAGVLGAFIPEFGRLLCMVLHDAYHIYTVDQHSLRLIKEIERLKAGEYAGSSPLLTQLAREVEKIELLYLGLMFHDIGKGFGGGHSEIGAHMVHVIDDLAPFREKRAHYEKKPAEVERILAEGIDVAQQAAAATMTEVRGTLGL